MIPEAAVEAAGRRLYLDSLTGRRTCEAWEALDEACQFHYRLDAIRVLVAAAPHLLAGETEWAIFRAQGGPNESPAENLRYKTREAAQRSIDTGYSQPQYWEVRGRNVGHWAK